jgi:serine-type D-Ala-D-Ala endopeptidase (penicillin-binding protein 7)
MNFFGPQKPIDDSSNLWRGIVALATIGVGLIVFIFVNSVHLPPQLQELSLVLDTVVGVHDDVVQAGGDVVIAPPEVVKPKLPELIKGKIPQDDFSAESMIVKDNESGMVMYRKSEYSERSIASLTKLMSALVVLEKNPDWLNLATVIEDDIFDTHMYAGDTYTIEQLWQAALVGSSNKAIYTLADAVGWPRVAFVERMNQKALELGMIQTKFIEPTGLDAGNQSTASDLAMLLNEALRSEKIRTAMATKELNLYSEERQKKHHMWNTNWLLLGWITNDLHKFRGGKTGYIPESGYNFMMQVSDADNHIIDVVVLGANSHEARFTEARDIAEWTFDSYKWP